MAILKRFPWRSLVVLALLVASCAPSAPPTPTPAPKPPAPAPAAPAPAAQPTQAPKPAAPAAPTAAPTAAPKPAPTVAAKPAASPAAKPSVAGKTLRMAYVSAPDFGNVYQPILTDAFKAKGVEYKPTFFNNQDAAVKALLIGEADFMQLQMTSVILNNPQGANMRSLMSMKANEWSLVTPVSLKTPQDLNGKRVGIHGPGTLTEILVNSTIKKYNLKPNVLVVPGSDARAQALMNGQLDATPADFGSVISILQAKPGQYHVLVPYAKDLSFLKGSTLIGTKALIDKDPDLIQAAVSTWYQVLTRVTKEPSLLKTSAAIVLPKLDAATLDAYTKEYLAVDYWNPELTEEIGRQTLQFMQETGQLKGDLPSLDTFMDLRFLQKAKQEAGSAR